MIAFDMRKLAVIGSEGSKDEVYPGVITVALAWYQLQRWRYREPYPYGKIRVGRSRKR